MTKNLDVSIQEAQVGNSEGIYIKVNDRSSRKILLEKYIPSNHLRGSGFFETIQFQAPGSEEK